MFFTNCFQKVKRILGYKGKLKRKNWIKGSIRSGRFLRIFTASSLDPTNLHDLSYLVSLNINACFWISCKYFYAGKTKPFIMILAKL